MSFARWAVFRRTSSAFTKSRSTFSRPQTASYFVFDRRGHTVHVVDAEPTVTRKLLDIGQEDGRVIQPTGFDVAADGRFVVADVPRAQQRVQTFDRAGKLLTGFFLPGEPAARVVIGSLMLNGAGSVQHTGESLLISHPESGALFTEYSPGATRDAASGGCGPPASKPTATCTSR